MSIIRKVKTLAFILVLPSNKLITSRYTHSSLLKIINFLIEAKSKQVCLFGFAEKEENEKF